MMSQNSHVNGQPRENCTDMKEYLFSANWSNARSTRRIFHCLGQSAATVMRPSGGTRERSGTISITSPRLQNEAGKRGQTIRTLIAGPSGGKDLISSGSRFMNKSPSYQFVELASKDWKKRSITRATATQLGQGRTDERLLTCGSYYASLDMARLKISEPQSGPCNSPS